MIKQSYLHTQMQQIHAEFGIFQGWELPSRFSETVLEEAVYVRKYVGIQDVSYKGILLITGMDSLDFLYHLTTNDVGKLSNGEGQYTFFLDEQGTILGLGQLFRFHEEKWLLITHSLLEPINKWVHLHRYHRVNLNNISDQYVKVSIQGPESPKLLADLIGNVRIANLPQDHMIEFGIYGYDLLVSRSGTTGEIGFDLYIPYHGSRYVFGRIESLGQVYGLKPFGFLAHQVLMIESGQWLWAEAFNKYKNLISHPWIHLYENPYPFIGKDRWIQNYDKGWGYFMQPFRLKEYKTFELESDVHFNDQLVGKVLVSIESPHVASTIGYVVLDFAFRMDSPIEIVSSNPKQIIEGTIVGLPFVEVSNQKPAKTDPSF